MSILSVVPFIVDSRLLLQVVCGPTTTAAISADGELFIWGNNAEGMLGVADGERVVPAPVLVPGMRGVVSVALGAMHGLAVVPA